MVSLLIGIVTIHSRSLCLTKLRLKCLGDIVASGVKLSNKFRMRLTFD